MKNAAAKSASMIAAQIAIAGIAGLACAGDVTPGFHDAQPTATPGVTYVLHVPVQYASATQALFPVLFCQNPGGKPAGDVKRWAAWADRWGVLVVGINGPNNGMPQGEKPKYWDAVPKALTEAGLRVHPTLRFTYGVSGGSADSGRMIRRRPEQFAGACLVCTFAQVVGVTNTTLAIGVVHGGKDSIASSAKVLSDFCTKKSGEGLPVRWTLEQMGQHTAGPAGASEGMLTWMLWFGRLNPQRVSAEELVVNSAAANAWAAQIASEANPERARSEADLFLHLPTTTLTGHSAVSATWVKQQVAWAAAHAEATRNPADRLGALQEAMRGETWTATTIKSSTQAYWIVTGYGNGVNAVPPQLTEADRQQIDATMATWAKDPAIAAGAAHREAFRSAVKNEVDAGLDFELGLAAAKRYAAVAARSPSDPWCRAAAEHAARLFDWVQRKAPADLAEKARQDAALKNP